MASIDIDIAGRKFTVACRDGEEDHLRSVGALVDKRARDAAQALGSLGEARLLLFTALMLADDSRSCRKARTPLPLHPGRAPPPLTTSRKRPNCSPSGSKAGGSPRTRARISAKA
jgi:cell division protein ZapA